MAEQGVTETVVKAGTGVLGKVAATGMDGVVTALKGIGEVKGAGADVATVGIGAADASIDAMLEHAEALLNEINAFVQRTLGRV